MSEVVKTCRQWVHLFWLTLRKPWVDWPFIVSKLDIYIHAVTSFTYFHIIGNFKHIWNSIITWERNPINANNVVSHLDLQYLQVHRRNTRAEPNGLKDCGKSFCFHGSFKQHKRTHTVEKTREYKKCSKILLQFWSLSYIYIREITLEESLVEANDVKKHLAITVVPLPSQSMKTEKCYVYSRASLVHWHSSTQSLTIMGNHV